MSGKVKVRLDMAERPSRARAAVTSSGIGKATDQPRVVSSILISTQSIWGGIVRLEM